MPKVGSLRNKKQDSSRMREDRQGSGGMSREALVRSKNARRALRLKYGDSKPVDVMQSFDSSWGDF